MQWFMIQDPGGTKWQFQASSPQSALQAAKNFFSQRGYGATDLLSVTVGATGPTQFGGDVLMGPQVPTGSAGGGGILSGKSEYARPAYLQGVENAGYKPESAWGGILQSRFGPTASNFWANKGLAQGRGQDTEDANFQDYSQANAGMGTDIWGAARDKFRQIAGGAQFGGTPESQAAIHNVRTGQNYGDAGDNPAYDTGAANIRANLEDLARSAAFGQYGDWGTTLLPSSAKLGDEFQQQVYANTNAGAAQGLDWADILKKRFGLR